MKQTKIMKKLMTGLFAVGALAMLYKPVTVNAATPITEVNFTVDFSKIPSVTAGEQVPYETADSGAMSIAESEKCSVYCEGWLSKQDDGGWDSVYDSIYNEKFHEIYCF